MSIEPFKKLSGHIANNFLWRVENRVGYVTLDRPERKNPLTFDSYAELRDLFRILADADDVRVIVVRGSGGNFCSGGDVHDIIGPLTRMTMPELLRFTRMTGDLVKAMRGCPQPIVAAVEGACAGAGAIIAMASDLRYATPTAKTAFLFSRVGLAGCDMGACALLPRIIGQGRAAELLSSVGLGSDGDKLPGQMSLGMQMRAALARALMESPGLLLMDEPFAAVDEPTRIRLDRLFVEVHSLRRFAAVFVTHSAREAVAVAHRIVVLGDPPDGVIGVVDVSSPGERPGLPPGDPRAATAERDVSGRLDAIIEARR